MHIDFLKHFKFETFFLHCSIFMHMSNVNNCYSIKMTRSNNGSKFFFQSNVQSSYKYKATRTKQPQQNIVALTVYSFLVEMGTFYESIYLILCK